MDSNDTERTQDISKENLERKLDSDVCTENSGDQQRPFEFYVTSPQQTPRFTDPYSASLYQTPECDTNTPSPHHIVNYEDIASIPTTDSNQSDHQGDQSPDDDIDEDCEDNLYQNPEPPKELLEHHLVDADNIGNTVFSKHWVFTTLMNLLKTVETEENSNDEDCASEDPEELDEALQDDLCKLWDMSMNQEVVKFLVEYNAIDLLTGVIKKSKSLRATEICVGLLGNMACSSEVCSLMGSKKELLDLVLLLLENTDAPVLVETMRMLHVCVSSEKPETWISAIKETKIVYDQVLFILQSSTNRDLLKNTAEFIDKLMEVDEDICKSWSNPEFVVAVMEAIKQTGSHVSHILETFFHVLQLVSTSEQGVQALASYCGQVCLLILGYLRHICADDIVGVAGRENVIGSALSILSVIFGLWDERVHLLQTDFQIIRCTLKILDVVYQKHLQLPPDLRNFRGRSVSVYENMINGVGDVASGDHLEGERQNSTTANIISAIQDSKNKSKGSAAEECDAKDGDGAQKSAGDCVKAAESNLDSPERNVLHRDSAAGCIHSDTDVTHDNDGKEEEYAQEMTKVLYEVLQTLLSEIVVTLSQIPASNTELLDGENGTDQDASCEASESEELPKMPMSLVYLEKLCYRYRLQNMLKTLNDTEEKNCIELLYSVGERHKLTRLCRIIDSTIPRNK